MNEAETRAEHIDPALKAAGWGVVEGSRIRREYPITPGRLEGPGRRGKPLIADYVLEYRNTKLAVDEAKAWDEALTEGVAQAKNYAGKMAVRFAYASNGQGIYAVDMQTGKEGQIAWKLFQARWHLSGQPSRRPRILFLADRNILANQAYNAFSAFPEDALVRIEPGDIRKKGKVPKNGSLFFTIFQTFMTSGADEADQPNQVNLTVSSPLLCPLAEADLASLAMAAEARGVYGAYPPDFFDFIVIDECHRGGANDESTWRGILDYFEPAVKLGLTATPKRDENVDTYRYFGDPVYIYSLKDGINDGFLTPFKVKQIQTTLDYYIYTPDDEVLEGEIKPGKVYEEPDFNRDIEIIERERKRVALFMDLINQNEKTLVFCASQDHALAVRDLINQMKTSRDPNYCQRVTADEGELGKQHLRDFQDNEKTIPTILTTSQKLSTGVDARNIVLMRPINRIIARSVGASRASARSRHPSRARSAARLPVSAHRSPARSADSALVYASGGGR